MSSDFNAEGSVYTPQQSAALAVENIKRIQAGMSRAMRFDFGSTGMNEYIVPLLPGDTMSVIAQTSNFKSGFLRFLQYQWVDQLVKEGRSEECVVHISVEEPVEVQINHALERYSGEFAGHLARGQVSNWGNILMASMTVASIPIYRIGDSLMNPVEFSQLYLSNIRKSLNALVEGRVTGKPVKPAVIILDYLQALPRDPARKNQDRRLDVRDDVYAIRDMSKFYGCPVVFASQAKQTLDNGDKNWRQPGIYDGSEAKEVAERPDRILSLWLPKQSHPVGSELTSPSGIKFLVEENMLFIKVCKQRGGFPAGQTFMCRVDYATQKVTHDIYFGKNAQKHP